MSEAFRARYGPWALVAGASEGLGAAFAEELAARGVHLLLIARRPGPLEALAGRLRDRVGIEVRTASLDLGGPGLDDAVRALTRGLTVGLVVYNAADSFVGEFLDRPLGEHLRTVDVNCRGPVVLAHVLGKEMAARGRGGIVLVSSMAGFQGSALVATYAATKGFDTVLAEGLWDELRGRGVDVLACCAGATRTPGYEASQPRGGVRPMAPAAVAADALAALGRGPTTIPGMTNRVARLVMRHLMPRRVAVRIMGTTTRRMYGLAVKKMTPAGS
ncbi:MAG TPA: SDR family NAD(P)-dependent oxidoreductase [Candidatus Binatus sp.]|nr:SDR family NAD(P)-dependent oxidoreductase [Candidatus Binatus sp.]